MTNIRASLIDDLDLSEFQPKSSFKDKGPSADEVRIVSEEANFHSREPLPNREAHPTKGIKRSYYKKGGNKQQFNIKAEKGTIDTFYSIAKEKGWSLGDTLQNAVVLLEQQLRSNT